MPESNDGGRPGAAAFDRVYAMTASERRIAHYLVQSGLLDQTGLRRALEHASRERTSFQSALVQLQLVHAEAIVQLLSGRDCVPFKEGPGTPLASGAVGEPGGDDGSETPEVVILQGGCETSRLRLETEEISIGRDESNLLVIKDRKVSRRHARIVQRDGSWVLQDLASTTGCFVGGEAIREHLLQDGDRVQIGDHEILFLPGPGRTVDRRAPAPRRPLLPPQAAGAGTLDLSVSGTVVERGWGDLKSALEGPDMDRAGLERLQALFEISQIVESAQEFDGVLVQIMDRAIAIMGAERGFLMLPDPQTNRLRVHVARDRGGNIEGVEKEAISHGVVQRAIESHKPVHIVDAQSDTWRTESLVAHQIHAAMCVPLMTRNTVTGVIYVDHRSRPFAFSESDLAFFATFALQAQMVIAGSRATWEIMDSLFRASDDLVLVCSREGRITQFNRAAHGMIEADGGSLGDILLEELFAPEDRDLCRAFVHQTLDEGTASGCELVLTGRAGTRIPMSVSSFALRDSGVSPFGFCLIGRDLTEIKKLIGELTDARDRLTIHNTFIRKTFGRYLSDDIVKSLLETPEGLALGGERRKVTILMSDLRGFTAVSERLEPEQVVWILNTYLGTMVEVIQRHGGTIDEFIGDAVLVIFGAPVTGDDDTRRAAACALEMQLAMTEVNAVVQGQGFPMLEMGIALNTAEVVVGNIGSHRRSKYGVVGRAVNVTSRIESYTVGRQILIADSTRAELGELARLGDSLELRAKGIRGILAAHDLRGLGPPYDLELPEAPDDLVALREALSIKFSLLDGKQVDEEAHVGEILELSERGAIVRSDRVPETMTNIKVVLDAPGTSGYGEIYARVIPGPGTEPSRFAVRFTYVPEEIRSCFASWREDGSLA